MQYFFLLVFVFHKIKLHYLKWHIQYISTILNKYLVKDFLRIITVSTDCE